MALPDLESLPEWKELCLRYRYDISRFAVEALDMQITWQQDLLFRSIAIPGSRTSVASGHGCFGKGTMVQLDNGEVKPVERLDIDDVLINGDGKTPIEITNLVKGKELMYLFSYADGTHHSFNASHILCLRNPQKWGKEAAGHTIRVTVAEYLTWSARKRRAWCMYRLASEFGTARPCYETIKIKRTRCIGIGNYYGIAVEPVNGGHTFVLADRTIVHNTGKSRSAGVVALWHLLFFEHSVTLFTAPQITQLKKIVWKEIKICWNRMKTGPLAWLADYVKIFSEEVYITGHKETWHVLAKTAPKHQPTNIAGEHGDNYLLWVDEASGVEDAIYDVIMGALTHADNRAVLTSQPTRNAGFFYNTHHAWSHRAGGVWVALTFNGEESPLVSEKTIAEMLEKYGHREDTGYQIRVLGRFPDRSDEFLVSMSQADAMFQGDSLFKGEHDDWGYIITVDVGGGVGRDDSVIAVSKVWGNKQWGPDARRVEVVDIPLCKNKDDLHELTGIIEECLRRYSNATLVVDDNGAGIGLGQNLKRNGIWYKSAKWSGQCFKNDNRKEYANKRSQANVCLSRAIAQGRFKVKTNKYKVKFKDQVTRIPYFFDEYSRFKVMSKEDMKKKGLKSPDVADVFAFLFLEGVNYSEAQEVAYGSEETRTVVETKKSKWAKLGEHAASL